MAFVPEKQGSVDPARNPVLVGEGKDYAPAPGDFQVEPINRPWLLAKLGEFVQHSPQTELLIMDDDEVSRYVLTGLLADTRFTVTAVANGQEGLQLARERRPAAIFLDLKMPGLSGFEVLEQLKADESTKDIPVIIHSSINLTAAERAWLTARAVAFVPKARMANKR